MLELFDTHCHIQSAGQSQGEANTISRWQKLGLDRSELVVRAKAAAVNRLLVVGCDLADSRLAADFASSTKELYAAVGIHPHEAKRYASAPDLRSQLDDLVSEPSVVAVGECGLDYFYSHSEAADQKSLLVAQLTLAKDKGLPVVFHVREAFADFWPIYDQFKLPGVIHSFSDSQANLEAALQRGLYIGVNGLATFSKSADIYRQVPLGSLLL